MKSWKEELLIWRWWALLCVPTIILAAGIPVSWVTVVLYTWSGIVARLAAKYIVSAPAPKLKQKVMASVKCDETSSVQLSVNDQVITIHGGTIQYVDMH